LARRTYLETEAGRALPGELQEFLHYWNEHDAEVYAYWDSLPQTVLHGDSHLATTYAMWTGGPGTSTGR
jgi:hypothetical protein